MGEVFQWRMTAPKIGALIPNATTTRQVVGLASASMKTIRRRTQHKHLDADERRLPDYKVHTEKRGRWEKTTGAPATGNTVPPEIFQQIRAVRGSVARPKAAIKGRPRRAAPLYYRGGPEHVNAYTKANGTRVGAHTRNATSAVAGKSKRHQWGWLWKSKSDFLADQYGGQVVDYTRTGSMWNSSEIKPRAARRGQTAVAMRFRGTNPRGTPSSLWKKYRDKRRVPASIRSYFLNRRDSHGNAIGHTGRPRVWFHFSDREAAQARDNWNKIISGQWHKLPTIEVSTRKGGAAARIG